jgi:hypothetical protein
MKNAVFWDVKRRVALVRTDISEELSAYFIRVSRIGEQGSMLTTNAICELILRYIPPKSRLLQGAHGVTSHKMAFFIVTAVKTSNLT